MSLKRSHALSQGMLGVHAHVIKQNKNNNPDLYKLPIQSYSGDVPNFTRRNQNHTRYQPPGIHRGIPQKPSSGGKRRNAKTRSKRTRRTRK